MGNDGSRYVFVVDHEQVDVMGQPISFGHAQGEQYFTIRQGEFDAPSTSQNPRPGVDFTFSNADVLSNNPLDFDLGKDELSEPKWEICITKSKSLEFCKITLIRIVYRVGSSIYYSTTNIRGIVLPQKLIIVFDKLSDNFTNHLVDILETNMS